MRSRATTSGPTAAAPCPLGNTNDGVRIEDGASGNTVGGTVGLTPGGPCTGACNLIAHNGGDGVAVVGNTTTGNTIAGNAIHANDGLGIDLGGDGVTANDVDDSDTGPNQLQNFPVLVSALSTGSTLTVEGMLTSAPSTTFRVEFFANEAYDPSGFGEGQVLLGTEDVTTTANGTGGFSIPLSTAVPAGQFVTATATDPADHTSEFSACLAVEAAPAAADLGLAKEVNQPTPHVGQQVMFIVTMTNYGPGPATGLSQTRRRQGWCSTRDAQRRHLHRFDGRLEPARPERRRRCYADGQRDGRAAWQHHQHGHRDPGRPTRPGGRQQHGCRHD